MIQIIKEAFDIEINCPAVFPAALSSRFHSLMSRFTRTVPVRVGMKYWFHKRFDFKFHNHLRHSIRYRRYSQYSDASIFLWNSHFSHRWWKVGPRRHPIPDFVEISFQIFLEFLDALPVDAGGTSVGFYLSVGLLHSVFGNKERFCVIHVLLLLSQLTRS